MGYYLAITSYINVNYIELDRVLFSDKALDDANDPSTLFTMIAPGIVFFVIFAAYFAFRCPVYRNRKK
jgi:hypothetical protein